ncbi:MAG: hypothetical protein HQL57_06425 [Magnetococcales bacterium]|nr:hypothetical protein [Magnetococcales bacterium]
MPAGVAMSAFVPPLFCGLGIPELSGHAARFMNAVGRSPFDPKFDPALLVDRLRGRLNPPPETGTGPAQTAHSLLVRGVKDFDLHIPENKSPREQRLLIMLGLAHYLLHYPMLLRLAREKGIDGSGVVMGVPLDGARGAAAVEARVWALAALCPEVSFEAAYQEFIPQILQGQLTADDALGKLANAMNLTPDSIRFRMRTLDLSPYTDLKTQSSRPPLVPGGVVAPASA